MTHEWKAGDVALVSDPVHGRLTMVHVGHDPEARCWHGAISNGDLRCLAADQALDAWPLVIVDPEDMTQVKTLRDALWKGGHLGIWQDTLREFANPTPPKPDEPTGLGAVVEVSNGDLYVRDKTTTTRAHWKRARGQEGGARHRYSDLAVVRVLSEGVPA